jgi:hypothetical protein
MVFFVNTSIVLYLFLSRGVPDLTDGFLVWNLTDGGLGIQDELVARLHTVAELGSNRVPGLEGGSPWLIIR